ncbi:F-BAR and double SH3 domains protein 1-like isoform X2 [Polyodon spathula]|uniref:F-BAR and double SH3 domains protein 1-like isoform X2 n=1 Tax=Polyodon spathula TaxID=7913 RepID=UPI001B7DF6CE|nr:F-BAR and double SH3 domains protein 1-like isoform X2 [Polyodon spathula]
MQPPPRKVKVTQEVKVTFAEQAAKLQSKQQQESELLEEIRSFSKQRAAIEKDYGQALHRLASQYMKRDGLRGKGEPSDSSLVTGAPPRSVFTVWRSLIEATVHTSLSRVAASENYRALTSETVRTLRAAKEQRAKKSLEQLLCVQGELVEAVRELSKVKKRYYHLERITELTRVKAKKNDYGIFHFRTNLQKLNTKLSNRLSECNLQLTEARNEYLLTLAAVNSHHEHYHSKDLPAVIKDMDADLYERLKEHFTLLSQTEIDSCRATQSTFLRVLQDSCQVSREHDLQLFLQENPVFTKAPVFLFQGAPSDKVCGLVHQDSAQRGESCLEKEARKWATKAAKDYKIKTHGERVLQTLDKRRKLVSEDEVADVELKMEEVKESIRKAEVSRVKAHSRLALLRLSGVETDAWVMSAMSQASKELESERQLSEARISNGDVSPLWDEFDFDDFDDGETFTESAPSPCPRSYPLPCRVLYSYQACQADELSITEDEELEVIEDGDMEDWVKARNASGQVGYVPKRYLQFPCLSAGDAVSQRVPGSPLSGCMLGSRGRGTQARTGGLARALYPYCGQSVEELSFPEGAVIRLLRCRDVRVDDGFWEGELNGRVGVFPSLVVELLGEEEEEEEEEEEDGKVSTHSNHFLLQFFMKKKSGLKKNNNKKKYLFWFQELLSPGPPPFSPPVPILGAPSLPVPESSLPGRLEDRLQGIPLGLLRQPDSRADSGSSAHSSPDHSPRLARPVRAPPRHRPSPSPCSDERFV